MKKITLLLFTLLLFNLNNAQSVVWSDDFNDEDISDWTLIDDDGDGLNWGVVQIQDNMGNPVDTPQLRSASWIGGVGGGPLTPDNWIISPLIDLSSASGSISLDWLVKASDADYDAENYTVYVATGNTINDFLASGTSFNEPTLDGVNTQTPRTLDISSFAGEAIVYVAFRHHGVSDEFTMEVDDVSVSAQTLSIPENELTRFNHFYNINENVLTLDSANSAFESAQFYNILGKEVINKKLSKTIENIDISTLSNGIYLVRVSIEGQSRTIKIIKS
ncbi:choice-of-anchor J domain-containing protein [Winogradskyella sp.]|uniref:T9SS-dependent choice-of-anchor J family protein n=1 Tax=Winogradskyella sp. TaxID=1883156 RepID=UPI00262BCAB5|nr:choice-of-anchor J domain-containing protein [Winogradskyella sp.]